MKLIYSPDYGNRVFVTPVITGSCLMDTAVCDTAALVRQLESRLGLHVEDQPHHMRLVKYFKALGQYMSSHPGNALTESFGLSGLGTAEQALGWRDELLAARWQPLVDKTVTGGDGRLDVIAGTEPLFDAPGVPDRLLRVLDALKACPGVCDGMEVVLPCVKRLLHPVVIELIDTMQACGATVTEYRYACPAEARTNLERVARLLHSTAAESVRLDPADRSLRILRFADGDAADEYMAHKGDSLGAELWINSDNKSLDNWCRLMGKPAMGSSMDTSAPQVLQLMLLGIGLMHEPLNINDLINWLYCPLQPMGKHAATVLAEAVIGSGGYRNKACREVIENYLKGEYEFRDKEKEAAMTDAERNRRDRSERERRQVVVDTYLPPMTPASDKTIDVERLLKHVNSLASWALQRMHLLSQEPGNAGWCSQLESLARMCETMVLLVGEETGSVEVRQVDSWLSTLYKGETFMQYATQVGAHMLIGSPACMHSPSRSTVWMHFTGDHRTSLSCNFLFNTERARLEGHWLPWDRRNEAEYRQQMELRPMALTTGQMTLVVTEHTNGAPTPKHPLLVRLEKMVENLDALVESPTLLGEATEQVVKVSNGGTGGTITFKHAGHLRWPEHMSHSALDVMVQYPLDYLLHNLLHIDATGPGSIKAVYTTQGIVAHEVIEKLFKRRDGERSVSADEIRLRIDSEFDSVLRGAIEASGAILDLPEHRHETELFTTQLRHCLANLLEIIEANGLRVTDCELPVTAKMGIIDNSKGWDMKGFIDMTLVDAAGNKVVFDFKWTPRSKKYAELLEANRSTQLALYSAMLGHGGCRTAYFLMPEGRLYSHSPFNGINCTQVAAGNADDIVAQLMNSYRYRRDQLERGIVENGEGAELTELAYCNDTASQNLFPLPESDEGTEKPNYYSDYTLFK